MGHKEPKPLPLTPSTALRAGWLWCTTGDGATLWVPEPWVEIEGDRCVLLRDYDPTELTLEEGESITGELSECSWLPGTTPDGRRGWVPLECLQVV
jgi:hypothetical protein